MADLLYRHKKTGEQKHLPEKVYQAVRKHWELVEESKPLPESVYKAAEAAVKNEGGLSVTPVIQHSDDADLGEKSKEELQAEYEELTGEKPDGRWSVKKLSEKIQEQKEK